MNGSVAIIGGGIAGLTVAHELIERGFRVTVYERRAFFGGKAASYRRRPKTKRAARELGVARDPNVWDCAPCSDRAGLPGEHGFRFFPGWYRHLIDTMSRIPYHKVGGGRRSVADNLVTVPANRLAWFDRPSVTLPLQIPRTAEEVAVATQFWAEFTRLGLSSGEIALFFRKVLEVAASSEERRIEQLEKVTWWEFLECDAPGRSQAYRDLVRASTRTSVAAKAEEVSAYTIGRLVVRTLFDTLANVDRVLNGPSNEAWIDPWIAYLKARGVRFQAEMELQSLTFDGAKRRIKNASLEPVPLANLRRVRELVTACTNKKATPDVTDLKELRSLIRALRRSAWLAARTDPQTIALVKQLASSLSAVTAQLRGPQPQPFVAALKGALTTEAPQLLAAIAEVECDPSLTMEVEADHFVLALPLEQLAYYVDRSTMATFLAPELRQIVRLSFHMDWMAGIQFYLEQPLDISPGHLVGVDSTWALTAIEQTQFWKDVVLPSRVKAVLSVDISAWDEKGRIVRKEAFNCSDQEIAREVWGQLKEMLNRNDRVNVLRDPMLVGGKLTKGVSFHLDDNVVDLRDRKKQAFYERARGLEFNTLDLIAKDTRAVERNTDGKTDDAYTWGPKRRFNAEPLLLNRPGSRALRPGACTSIPNLFLAGDFIKTETDLACMEGANEAGRRAVNGILDAAAAREARCDLWAFSPSRQVVETVLSMGGLLRVGRDAAAAASQLQDQFWKRMAIGMLRVQGAQPALPAPSNILSGR